MGGGPAGIAPPGGRALAVLLVGALVAAGPLAAAADGRGGPVFNTGTYSFTFPDQDNDTLAEAMVFSGNITLPNGEHYWVNGTLSPEGAGDDVKPEVAHQDYARAAGEFPVVLSYPAHAFQRMRYNGTYLLELEAFMEGRPDAVTTWSVRTPALFWTQFEPVAATATINAERITDAGIDLDKDGWFDFIVVSAPVTAAPPGPYIVRGDLEGIVAETEVRTASNPIVAAMEFPASALHGLGHPGPYEVTVRVLTLDGVLLAEAHYLTAPYRPEQLEPPPPLVVFEGTPVLGTPDADQDGLLDAIWIAAELWAYRPTDAMVVVRCFGAGTGFAIFEGRHPVEARVTGLIPIRLVIPGPVIAASGTDGPYRIVLEVRPFSPFPPAPDSPAWDRRVLETRALAHSDFEAPPPPVRFIPPLRDAAIDVDRDGDLEGILIEISAEILTPGEFEATARLARDGVPVSAAGSSGRWDATGQKRLEFRFPGHDIAGARVDGPYAVEIRVIVTPPPEGREMPRPQVAHFEGVTSTYAWKDFTAKVTPKPDDPKVHVGIDTIRTEASVMTFETTRTAPEIAFTYSPDNETSFRFRLVFSRLILFNDTDSDAVLDESEARFEAALDGIRWQTSPAAPDSDGGVRYEMEAIVSARPVGGSKGPVVPSWARVRFSFSWAPNDTLLGPPFNYTLAGGTELKIDFRLEVLSGLRTTRVALEHYLSDESGKHVFATDEAGGMRVYAPNGETRRVFAEKPGAVGQRILLREKGKDVTHGFYGWLTHATGTTRDGQVRDLAVPLEYVTDGNRMRLLLSYPLGDITNITHDPSVGVDPANRPVRYRTALTSALDPSAFVLSFILMAVALVVVWRRLETRPSG